MSHCEFKTLTGKITIDYEKCLQCKTKICVSVCEPRVYELKEGKPVLRMTEDEVAKGGCVECVACELDCHLKGNQGLRIEFPMEQL